MSLHCHSHYSALDGWSTPDEMGDRFLEIGLPFGGITDHGTIAGHIDFDKALRKRDLIPVYGCELYFGIHPEGPKAKERDQAHLIALAQTDEGLRNLWRLTNSAARQDHFHYVPRVFGEELVKFSEGIIFTSACPLGLVPQGLLKGDTYWLNWYLDNLGDKFRIEITTYPGDVDWSDDGSDPLTPRIINELLVEAAQERGVPITYGDDGHFSCQDDWKYHDMYLARQTGQSVYTPIEERKMYHPPGAVCIKDEDEVRKNLSYLPDSVVDEAILNTWEIGVSADAHLPEVDKPHLPVFIPSECPWIEIDKNATELFVDLVGEGVERRYGGTEQEAQAWERAAYEMETLMEDKLEHYFLADWDKVQFCKHEGIMQGPSRGSSGGSIVAYALEITDVDPLHYGLFFERFWNKGRTDGFPDIDSDFPREAKPKIREYLIKRWGEKRVTSIGNVVRLKPIETINKLAEACEISFEEKEEIKSIVEDTHDIVIHGPDQIGWNPDLEPGKVIYVKEDVGDRIDEWIGENEKRQVFIEMCEHTCSRVSHFGVHASGIVISDIDLDDYAPSTWRGNKKEGVAATEFPMKIIESLKLVKEDVLGLRTLDTLEEWEKQMKAKDIEIDWSGLDKQEWPDAMWSLLDEGFLAGIFQLETPSGRKLTEELKPRSIHDLGLVVALNRPGPIRAKIPERYRARKEGKEEVTYAHPILEEILSSTQGLICYQEQIINFMSKLGYTLGEADAVRKILGKKQPEKLQAIFEGSGEWKDKGFLDIAIQNGFDKYIAEEIWKELEGFASYSFNLSHSIGYGIIAFRCLLAKYYGPAEWYIACMRTVEKTKKAELFPSYIKEARRMGIEVLPPDIRYSQGRASVYKGKIYFGFEDIKNVSSSGPYIAHLRDNREYDTSSPEAFLEELEEDNDKFLKERKEALKEGQIVDGKTPKQMVNTRKIECLFEAGAWDGLGIRDIDLRKKQELEKELLGVVLTDNTKEILEKNIDALDSCDDFSEAITPWEDKENEFDWEVDGEEIPYSQRLIDYRLPGIITNVRETKSRSSGSTMGIVTIEYEGQDLTFVCFPKQWKSYKFLFKPLNVGIFCLRHKPPGNYGESYNFQEGYLLQ